MTIESEVCGRDTTGLPFWAQNALGVVERAAEKNRADNERFRMERRGRVNEDGFEALATLGIEAVGEVEYQDAENAIILSVAGYRFQYRGGHTGSGLGLFLLEEHAECGREVLMGPIKAVYDLGVYLGLNELPYHRCGDVVSDKNYRRPPTALAQAVAASGPTDTEAAFIDVFREFVHEEVEAALAARKRGAE